jgi:hypothetical protein
MGSKEELEEAGDELQRLIDRALEQFMVGSDEEGLRILDVEGARAIWRCNQLRGRPVPTDAEILAGRRALADLGRTAQERVDEAVMSEVRRTSEGQ